MQRPTAERGVVAEAPSSHANGAGPQFLDAVATEGADFVVAESDPFAEFGSAVDGGAPATIHDSVAVRAGSTVDAGEWVLYVHR